MCAYIDSEDSVKYLYIYDMPFWTTWVIRYNYLNCNATTMPMDAWVDMVILITLLLGSFFAAQGRLETSQCWPCNLADARVDVVSGQVALASNF